MMATNTARQLETPVAPLKTQPTVHKQAVASQSKKKWLFQLLKN